MPRIRAVHGGSLPVIGRARKDRGGAVKLFGQHHPGQHVGPDHLAEGQLEICFVPEPRLDPVRPADDEGRVATPLVAPAAEGGRRNRVRKEVCRARPVPRSARPWGSPGRATRPRRPCRRPCGLRPRSRQRGQAPAPAPSGRTGPGNHRANRAQGRNAAGPRHRYERAFSLVWRRPGGSAATFFPAGRTRALPGGRHGR